MQVWKKCSKVSVQFEREELDAKKKLMILIYEYDLDEFIKAKVVEEVLYNLRLNIKKSGITYDV